jgi:anti-sigma factor RsiW
MSARIVPLACQELVELVTDYLEGQLPAAEHARFDEHIAACDACTRYLEQMRVTIIALGHLPPESLSPEAERDLLAAFRDWRAGQGVP